MKSIEINALWWMNFIWKKRYLNEKNEKYFFLEFEFLLNDYLIRDVLSQLSRAFHWRSRSFAWILFIDVSEALSIFSMAASRAMLTCWRRESQCSRIVKSASLYILFSSATDSSNSARRNFKRSFKLDQRKINKLTKLFWNELFIIIF